MPTKNANSMSLPAIDEVARLDAHLRAVAVEAEALTLQLRLCHAEMQFIAHRLEQARAARRRWSGTAHAYAAAALAGHAETLARMLSTESARPEPLKLTMVPEAQDEPLELVREDLSLIRGVDSAAFAILLSFGITHFRDIAAFKPDDVEVLSRALGDNRRISRENWIEQAAVLARGKLTAFARERMAMTLPPDNIIAFPAAPEPPESTRETEASAALPQLPAVRATGTDLVVVPFPRNVKARSRWPLVAGSLAMLAVASLATFGIRPALAQYLEGFSCSQSSIFPVGCAQVSWLQK